MIAEPDTSVRIKYNAGLLRPGTITTVLPPHEPNEFGMYGTPEGWTCVKSPHDPDLDCVQPFGYELRDDYLEVIGQ
jgi:hypothetical protein